MREMLLDACAGIGIGLLWLILTDICRPYDRTNEIDSHFFPHE